MINRLYMQVYDTLADLNSKLNALQKHRSSYQQQYVSQIEISAEEVAEQKKELQKQMNTIKGLIAIASGHAIKRDPGIGTIPFNISSLSRLAVQINNRLQSDPNAEALYTQASSQLRYLEKQLDDLEHGLSDRLPTNVQKMADSLLAIDNEMAETKNRVQNYLQSLDYQSFITAIQNVDANGMYSPAEQVIHIGERHVTMPIPAGMEDLFSKASSGYADPIAKTIGLPFALRFDRGNSLFVEYTSEVESLLLGGLQNYISQAIEQYIGDIEQISFIDTMRYNSSSLGILSALASGGKSVIDLVPITPAEVEARISGILSAITRDEMRMLSDRNLVLKKRVLVFHNFPEGYDSTAIAKIQQLCVNAEHYNLSVIVTHNLREDNFLSSNSVGIIKAASQVISFANNQFYVEENRQKNPFKWKLSPLVLPVIDFDALKTSEVQTGNDYEQRVGIKEKPTYKKGIRRLENIPYAVDENGKILTIGFEDSDFATFLCGASRSGKSTLLHTILTGVIQSAHPDDVEIWLIDFKTTEFSHYIEHLPPHVRYILLDESPELVYDIIDRLTEVLLKRQAIFKNHNSDKLSNFPINVYMPELFVIIDEFSVMSEIIAEDETYKSKLQQLLARGGAFGFRFIFSSQGFSNGSAGLNAFAKEQIQQRIAMKTVQPDEVVNTLALNNVSETDRKMMIELQVHHTLVKVPEDEYGNHLRSGKVLFISDEYQKQARMIDDLGETLVISDVFEPGKVGSYIYKQPLIKDANQYYTFKEKRRDFGKFLENQSQSSHDEKTYLFVGDPRRMQNITPVILTKNFQENMLIIAPSAEMMTATSILLSIEESLIFGDFKRTMVWTHQGNKYYEQMKLSNECIIARMGTEEVCDAVRDLKERIRNRVEGDEYIFLLGLEELFVEMEFLAENHSDSSNISADMPSISAIAQLQSLIPSGLDLASFAEIPYEEGDDDSDMFNITEDMTEEMAAEDDYADAAQDADMPIEEQKYDMLEHDQQDAVYDARADIIYLIKNGPRYGYHFIMVCNSVFDIKNLNIPLATIKHNILFNCSAEEANEIVNSANAKWVSKMPSHVFRYCYGTQSLSYRPYFHPGLSWDGVVMEGNELQNAVKDEDYLL